MGVFEGSNTLRAFLARLRRLLRNDLISFGLLDNVEIVATALGSSQDQRGLRGCWFSCHIKIAFDDSNEECRLNSIVIHRARGVVAPCIIGVIMLSRRRIETFLVLSISRCHKTLLLLFCWMGRSFNRFRLPDVATLDNTQTFIIRGHILLLLFLRQFPILLILAC